MESLTQPNSSFIKVKCNECSTETIVFNHAKTIVVCSSDSCSEVLAQPATGKAIINGEILEKLEYIKSINILININFFNFRSN